MAKKVKGAAAHKAKPAPEDVQERWAEAVAAEEKAFANARVGGQMERVAHAKALAELVAAHDACEAATNEGAAEAVAK